MIKNLYKYVEYSFISDEPYTRYLEAENLDEVRDFIMKTRDWDPIHHRLIISHDVCEKDKWNFFWEADNIFGTWNVRPGYIEKLDYSLANVSNIFKNIDKIVLDMDLIAKNTIYKNYRGDYK